MLGLLMNKWVTGGLVGLLLLGFSFWKGYIYGSNSVHKQWDAAKVVQEREMLAMASKAIEKERELQTKADKIQREKHNAVKAADSKYAALIDSLRHRAETRSDDPMPDSTGDATGCTGAGLARPDAEFLAGFAADAARLQASYNACKAGYESVKNGTP
jgi:hypothetical protein